MPSYASAVADLLRQRRDIGQESVSLNLLILGRAIDAALPGMLESRNGNFYVGSARIESPADLAGTIRIPGVRFRHLLMVGDQTGVVSTSNPPASIRQPFNANDISGLIGQSNVAFLATMQKVWTEKIGPTGLLPASAVKAAEAVLSIGIIVYPETSEQLVALFPRLALDLVNVPNLTPEKRSRWFTIAEKVRADLSLYYKGQVDEAAAAVASAQFWTSVTETTYNAVEAVRDAPSTIVQGALDLSWAGIKSAFGVFARGPFFIVAGLAAVGAAAWWFWPRIAKAAVSKAKEARDG